MSLPALLQMPLFNVVLCFWSMLFAHITGRQNRNKPPVTPLSPAATPAVSRSRRRSKSALIPGRNPVAQS